jgi:hypothetical protein
VTFLREICQGTDFRELRVEGSRSRREMAWELIQAQMDLMDEVSGDSGDDADAN